MCDKIFDVHLKTHDKTKEFKCTECNEAFYLEWRLRRHVRGHKVKRKYCHYYDNVNNCPYEEFGCKFKLEESKICVFNKKCSNHLCQYQHDTSKNVEALTDTINHDKEIRKNVHFLTKSIETADQESFRFTSTPKTKKIRM